MVEVGPNLKPERRIRSAMGVVKLGTLLKIVMARKIKIKRRVARDQEETNIVTSYDPSEVYMLIDSDSTEINVASRSHMHEWILDLGASFHVTS